MPPAGECPGLLAARCLEPGSARSRPVEAELSSPSPVLVAAELGCWVATLAVAGGALLAFHLVRALSVRESTAVRWLRHRGLMEDARSIDLTVQYLLRLRWARTATTLVMIGVCALAAMLTKTWISFVS